ncbi:hypothetical protein LIER_28323 [Lithospermum erythrorhizon]|uniref:Uncharacterized protein n=1 Tax=Lithospermum erythrorhizon TaxID=34254 RepID=A0AAV3RFA4_LITER
MCLEDYLYVKELDTRLSEKPEKTYDKIWKTLDRLVLGIIRLCLLRNIVANIANETTTKRLIKALLDLYEIVSTNATIASVPPLSLLTISKILWSIETSLNFKNLL